ncbi:MAG: class I SAM-dependent methyltransferase, partial [Thermoplasmata archaeon]|nr:class I SAM-dependent methyltransferase [Thermoplasmata archaeon]
MPRPLLYGPLAEQYDRIYAEKEYDAEARELTRLARRYAPGARTLLDVACGTGRHLAAFRENFEVEGIDASPAMLRVARRRLGRSTRLTVGDMRSFDLGRTFDVLVCLFSAIGYLRTERDRRRTFRNFARHLAPGGVMLVEGWILPAKFRQRHLALQTASVRTHDGTDVKIVRLSSSQRRG